MMPHARTRAQDGTLLAYQHEGGGRPLVLLAGQANDHHWWDGVREDFHTTHGTITVDYRGTGDSDRPDGPYSTQVFAEDVIAVLDDLGIERADVYGTSMGGRVALWIAIRHPGRVRHPMSLDVKRPGVGRDVTRRLLRRRGFGS
ncbi:alpha/beta fold hydrolase [Spirillospora sp. CA-128828]|uniref:alpha/beta fold hydrolase n=1 Tax=Spirillospora sp. CA-128828 TaxID=3240033 RepID=UPI003D920EAB